MKKAILLLAASLGLAAAPGVLAQVTLTINTETPTTFSATISGTLTNDAGGNQVWLAIKPNFPASDGVNVPWITSFSSVVENTITFNGDGFASFNTIDSALDVSYGDSLYWLADSALTAGTIISGTVTISGTFDYSQVTSFALCDGYNGTTQDWNALVAATSSWATAPSITTQPSNTSVESGIGTNFTVTATGAPPLYYQWQFNSNNISGANDATYALAVADVADAGYYEVVITNAFGSVTSSVVTLAVTPTAPTVQWPTASAITYGQPLSASSLTDGSAAVDGSFAFATPTSVLNAGSPLEWVIFTPSDTNNYDVVSNTVEVTVSPASLTVTATNETIVYGGSFPAFTGTLVGVTNNDNLTVSFYTPAGAQSGAGTYPILPVFNDPNGVLPNYAVTTNVGQLLIQAAPLTVTANSTNRLYGQANPAFTGSLVGVVNGDNITPNYGSTATAASAVGTYAIVPTLADPAAKLGNYAVTTNNGTLTVGNATLTVSAASQTRNYGQANAAFTVNYSGFVNSQDASVVSGTPSFVCVDGNGVNVGPATPVGGYAIIPGGLTAPNYTLVYANGSVTINQATLTVTPNAATRTYGATNPVFAATFTGFANSETTNVISGQAALGTTAGLTSPVGGYPITAALGTLSATNYNFTFNTGTLTVGAAPLSGLVQSWERAYGQTNPVFTVAYSGFVNGETTNLVAGGIVYSCLDSNDVPVGTNTWVGTYGITVSTPQTAPNYAITYSPGSLVVTQAVLVVSADPQGKAFGTPNPPLTYTLSGFVNDDGTNVISGAPELSTSAVTNSPVGTYAIDISQGTLSATNYSFSLTNGVLTVAHALLTVTAVDQTRLYGQTNPVLTVQYSGFVDGDDQGILSGSPAVTTAAGTNTGVGSYAITVGTGTLVAPNYALQTVNGTLTINRTPLGIAAQNATRQYGSNNPVLGVTYTGLVNDENSNALSGTLTLTCTTDPTTDVGTYAIVPAGVTSTNYAISFTNGTLTITPAPLTVTANSTNRLYGQANPAFTGSLVGVVNGDNITPNYGSTATAASAVGTYAIVPTLADPAAKLGNYAVTTNNGTLTVGNATLTVSAASQTRNYGQANAAFTVNYSGFVNSQDASVVSGTPSFVCVDGNGVNVGPATPVGGYAIIPGGLTAPNYTLVYANGSVTINQATLTVTPNAATRTYGATNPVFAATFTGFANSETTNVISGQAALGTTAGLTSPVGGYPITAALGMLSATNYNFTFNTGTLTVGAAPLSGLVQSWERAYGQTNPVFTVAYSGFVNGETTNLVAGGIVYSCLDSNDVPVGTNTWVGTYGITVSTPQTAPNYAITYSPGSLVVTQAVLVVSADPQGKAFGTPNPPLTYTLSGFVNDDGTNVISGAPELSTSAVTNSPVGTYAIDISQGTLSATNYSFSLTNGVLTVAHALLTVTAVDQTRLYGQTNPVLTVQYSGFVDGDDQGILSGSPAVTTAAGTNTGVGSYAITVGTGTLVAPNYALQTVNGTLTINRTPLGIAAQNATRQYGSNNPVLGVTYTGLVNDENSNALSGTLTLTCTTDPTTDVGTYAIVPAGVTSTNYAISFTNGTLTITPAPLTVTANSTNRLYGQANPAFTGSLVGVVNGDNITPNYGSTATAASAVGTYAIVPTLADPAAKLGNYAVTTNNGTLTVGNATLTVSAASQTRNYGQANAAFTVNYSGFVNSQDASVVSGTPSFVCVDGNGVNVGPATPVGGYAIIPGGLTAPNYTLVYANGSVTINQATLTVTPNAATRTYGATNPVFAATFTGFANSETTNVISGQAALGTTAGLTSPVGGYPITAALGMLSATNYNFTFNTGTLTVGAAPLSGLVQSWERAYGQTNPVFTVAYSGFVNGETTNLVAGGIVYSCLDSNDVPVGTNTWVGTYGITVSTPQTAPNYAITYSPGSLVVTQAVLVVSADPQGKAFGTPNPPLTYTLSGFVNDDGTNVISGAPELSTSAVTNSPVGTYAIDISQGTLSATNYSFSLTNGWLKVAKATLTVTADNQTRLYGQTNPVLTVQYSGFVDGEDQGILSGSPAVATAAATNTGVGSYPIVLTTGTLTATNYMLSLVNGTLTINATPLGIAADNATRQYGKTNPEFLVTYSGLVNGEGLNVLSGTLTVTSATDATTDVGTYPIVPAGITSTNYAISFTNGTLLITPAPLTVAANNASRAYGAPNPAFTGNTTGLYNSDPITATYATTATAGSPVGTYAIVPSLVDPDNKAGDYAVTLVSGVLTVTLEVNNPYGTNVTGYYVVGDIPSPINTNALVADGGGLNYTGGKLVVTILTNGTAEDELTVDTEGTGAGEIDLSGTNVTYGGTTFASLAGGLGTEPLQFVFNASATTAAVSNLLRQVSFYTSNTNTAYRTLAVALTVASNTVVSYETLIVDRPPVTGATVLTAAKGATLQIPFSLILTNDYDVDGDPLTITDYSGMSTNGGWITNTGTALIYTPSAIQNNNDLFTYIVSDGRGGSTVGTVNLEFLVQNELNLTTFKLAANGAHLSMAGAPNHNYLIQATTNFITWTNLGTVTADSLGGMQFQDTTATNYTQRFYRAEEQ